MTSVSIMSTTSAVNAIGMCVYVYFWSTSAPPVSAEELAKKQRLEHMRKEHMAALLHEGGENDVCVCVCVCMFRPPNAMFCYTFFTEKCIMARLNLIKIKGLLVIKDLKVLYNLFIAFDAQLLPV